MAIKHQQLTLRVGQISRLPVSARDSAGNAVTVRARRSSAREYDATPPSRQARRRSWHVRVGSTNRRADAELTHELRRLVRVESFDEHPMLDADSEALDFRAASELFAPVRTLHSRDLTTLRRATNYQGRLSPRFAKVALRFPVTIFATRNVDKLSVMSCAPDAATDDVPEY